MLRVAKRIRLWEIGIPCSMDSDRQPRSRMFRCYRYIGEPVKDWQKRDNSLATPPLMLAEWPNKPRSMLAATARSREAAITWLWNETHGLEGQLLGQLAGTLADDGDWRAVREGFASTWYFLGHDDITVSHHWLTGRREAELVIVPDASPTLTRNTG